MRSTEHLRVSVLFPAAQVRNILSVKNEKVKNQQPAQAQEGRNFLEA